jgi:hypothetical protein
MFEFLNDIQISRLAIFNVMITGRIVYICLAIQP